MSQFQQSPLPDVLPRLAPDQIESLLIHLIRLESLLNEAMEIAESNLFNQPGEHIYDAVWRALTHYKREQRSMPTQPILFAQACAGIQGGSVFGGGFNPINTRMAADPQIFRNQVEQFTRTAFFYDPSHLRIDYAREILKRLLNERMVADKLSSILMSVGRSDVLINVPQAIAEVSAQNLRVQAIGGASGYGMLDHATTEQTRVRYPTGVSFIDKATSPMSTEVATDNNVELTGGWLPAETYLVLGPQGGGKTQTGMMLTIEASDRYAFGIRGDSPGTKRGGYYFHYEMPPEQISQRAIAYAAKIPTHRLIGNDFFERLSDGAQTSTWQSYELPWLQEDQRLGRPIRGERQRYLELRERMAHWRSFKMHGTDNGAPAGIGGVSEISAKIERSISKDGVIPSIVVIDYAKVCVTRKLQFANKDLDKGMRYELTSFADQCVQMIGSKYNCGVFVMHQLKGQSNNRPPSHVPHHSEASECSAMGEQFDYCFCYGVKQQENGCMWFNASKTRDSEGLRGPVIVKMEGSFSRIVEAEGYISINGTFRSASDTYQIANVSTRRPAPPGPRPLDIG